MSRRHLGLFLFLMAAPAWAGIVERVLAFSLAREDLRTLSQAVRHGYFGRPQQGEIVASTTSLPDLGPIAFDRVRYEFEVARLDLVPSGSGLRLEADIARLHARAQHIYFDPARTRYCRGIHVNSFGSTIPVRIEVRPVVTAGYHLQLQVISASVGVTKQNFFFQSVEECRVIWPFNWLVERILLATANTMQPQFANYLDQEAKKLVSQLGPQLEKLLKQRTPADGPDLFPTEVLTTSERVRLVLGARFPAGEEVQEISHQELTQFENRTRRSFLALANGRFEFPDLKIPGLVVKTGELHELSSFLAIDIEFRRY